MTSRRAPAFAAGLLVVALALTGCGGDDRGSGGAPATTTAAPVTTGAPPTTTAPATTGAVSTDAVAFCTAHGGTTEARQAYWGTNGDRSQWLALAHHLTLCRFVAADGSRLYIDVDSLASEQPSLAAAAYLAKLPLPSGNGANPAAVDCTQNLGGASNFSSTSASGGGWVEESDPTFTVVDLCVFADGSAIDQWAIAYYSDGIVRGADLAPLFRFDPTVVAKLFPPGSSTTR